MVLTFPFKDPDEILDYRIDWSERLDENDFITLSTWFLVDSQSESPPLLTIDSDSILSPPVETLIWLSGGTIDITYQLTNRIVTNGGRTMDQTVKLKIKAK